MIILGLRVVIHKEATMNKLFAALLGILGFISVSASDAADWSKPVVSDLYAAQVGYYKARDTDVALMFDPAYTSPTNVPTNAIRWNSANGVFERYNGTTWVTQTFNGATAVASTSALNVSSLIATGTTGVRSSNNAGGRFLLIDSNAATDTGVYDLSSTDGYFTIRALSDSLGTASNVFQCGPRTTVTVSQCQFYPSVVFGDTTADIVGFTARINTDFLPSTDNARDLGTAANSWRNLYVDGSAVLGTVFASGPTTLNGSVTLGDAAGDPIIFTGRVTSHVIPTTTQTYDIGAASTVFRNGYFGSLATVGNTSSATFTATGSCISGYTRDAVGHCQRSAYVSPTALTFGTCTAITLPSGATSIEIWSESIANAINATGARNAYIYAYSENTCTTLLSVLSNANGYEYSATTAGTDLGNDSAAVSVIGPTIYVRLSGSASNVSTGRIAILGYKTNN